MRELLVNWLIEKVFFLVWFNLLLLLFIPIFYCYHSNHKEVQIKELLAQIDENKKNGVYEKEEKALESKIKTLPVDMVRWIYEINENNIEDNDRQIVTHMTERLKEKYLDYLKNRHTTIKDLKVNYKLDNLIARPVPVSTEELFLADGKKIYVQPSRFDVLVEAQVSAFRNKDNTKLYSRGITFWLHLVTSESKDNGGLLVDQLEEIQWKIS